MCDQVRDEVTFFVPQSRGYLFDIPDLPSEVYLSLELYYFFIFTLLPIAPLFFLYTAYASTKYTYAIEIALVLLPVCK